MKNSIVVIFILYTIVPCAVFDNITYIWQFTHDNDSLGAIFSDTLRSRFASAIRECNKQSFITRLNGDKLKLQDQSSLLPSEYSILVENKANYLIRGIISKPDKKSPTNISIKLYIRASAENIAMTEFQYSTDFIMEDRVIDLILPKLISEICPAFNVDDIQRIVKAEELFNQKNNYLDDYKRKLESQYVNLRKNVSLDSCDRRNCNDTVFDTICMSKNISTLDLLIPVYGLYTSIKKKENVPHSLLFNLTGVGTLAGGAVFLAISEHDRQPDNSDRYKLFGSTLFATSAVSAIINGVIVAIQLKRSDCVTNVNQ